jgi:hypothetical protein
MESASRVLESSMRDGARGRVPGRKPDPRPACCVEGRIGTVESASLSGIKVETIVREGGSHGYIGNQHRGAAHR